MGCGGAESLRSSGHLRGSKAGRSFTMGEGPVKEALGGSFPGD